MMEDLNKDEILREAEKILKSGEPKPALKLLGEVLVYWGQSEKLFEETFELLHESFRNSERSLKTMEDSLKLSKDFQKIVGELLGLLSRSSK